MHFCSDLWGKMEPGTSNGSFVLLNPSFLKHHHPERNITNVMALISQIFLIGSSEVKWGRYVKSLIYVFVIFNFNINICLYIFILN